MANGMGPSDRKIVHPISNETVLGDVTIGAIVRVGAEWVVPNPTQAGIRRVQRAALLIEVRVGQIQHEAAPVAPREFGLKGVGVCMPEVSIGQQELSHQREGQSTQVGWRVGTVALRRIANRDTVSLGGAERRGVRSKFIQVLACDQAVHMCPEIRQPQSSITNDLAFKGSVVLLDAWTLDT